MISRETIRKLAAFESQQNCAITFYYQPETPQNKAHREEAILVKDLIRNALREAEKDSGKNACARADLKRILDIADRLHGNGRKAKAIFAENASGVWQEFDLPPSLPGTRLIINRRVHLKPLATVLEHTPTVVVCLIDRTKARLFRYQDHNVEEVMDFFNELPRRGKSDGWAGYDAGHAERHVLNDAKQHYKYVAEALLDMYERGGFEMLAIGCHDEQWADIEPQLHSFLKNALLGHFRIDPTVASPDQIKKQVESVLAERKMDRREGAVREVLGEAHRNGHGAIGLRRVLRSLEQGEVQTLLLGEHFHAPGYQCGNCGHIDMRMATECAMCGQGVKELDDIADAILGDALKKGFDVMYIEDNQDFEKAGHIAALLRFRADQNIATKLAS